MQIDPKVRQQAGWVVSGAIFAFLILGSMAATFASADPKSKSVPVQAGHLETWVRSHATAAILKGEDASHLMASVKISLPDIARAVESEATQSPKAALLYAEALTEQHLPVPPSVAKTMTSDQDPDIRLIGLIYETPRPPAATLRMIAGKMLHGSFLTKLARVEALEMAGDKQIRSTVFAFRGEGTSVAGIVSVAGIMFAIFMLSAGLLFFYNDSRNRGLLKPLGVQLEAQSLLDADRLALRVSQLLGLFVLASLPSLIPWEKFLSKSGAMAASLIVPDVVLIGGALLLTGTPVMGKKLTFAEYGLSRSGLKSGLLWGLGGFFGGIPLVIAGGLIFQRVASIFFPSQNHSLDQALQDPKNTIVVGAALFVAAVGAPIFEELMFRGTLLPALDGLMRGKSYRVPVAIGVSSLLFAACHSQGVPAWGVLGGIAVLCSLLCYQTRSIVPGMVVHVLWNTLVVFATLGNMG